MLAQGRAAVRDRDPAFALCPSRPQERGQQAPHGVWFSPQALSRKRCTSPSCCSARESSCWLVSATFSMP